MKGLIFIMVFALIGCGSTSETNETNEEKDKKFEISSLDKGVKCEEIEGGRQLAQGEAFPENYTGIILQCHPNGMVHRIGYFEKSNQEGAARSFYEDGTLKVDAIWQGGKLSGKTSAYYPSGKIQSTLGYKDGLKHGEQIVYYENGNLQNKAQFDNGEFVGEIISYYENGQMKMKAKVVNGEPDLTQAEFWTEDGTVQEKK